MEFGHLSRRFFGALDSKPLSTDDVSWAESQLLPGELTLWRRMNVADQAHAHAVARDVVSQLGGQAKRPVIAAALLHDVGKVEARLGTLGRVAATLIGKAGIRHGRVGVYLEHHELGAAMLREAGSDPLTVAWAREHELPRSAWTLPVDIAAALYAADNR